MICRFGQKLWMHQYLLLFPLVNCAVTVWPDLASLYIPATSMNASSSASNIRGTWGVRGFNFGIPPWYPHKFPLLLTFTQYNQIVTHCNMEKTNILVASMILSPLWSHDNGIWLHFVISIHNSVKYDVEIFTSVLHNVSRHNLQSKGEFLYGFWEMWIIIWSLGSSRLTHCCCNLRRRMTTRFHKLAQDFTL